MAIEFYCPHCNTLLKTPDDSGGQQAKCPKCGAISTIPQRGPVAATVVDSGGQIVAGAGPIGHGELRIGEAIRWSWQILKANGGLIIGAMFLYIVIAALGAWFVGPGLQQAMNDADRFTRLCVVIASDIAMSCLSIFLYIGLLSLLLKIARGQPASLGDLFSGADRIVPALIASFLVGIVTTLGFLLFIIPGIIFVFMFSQTLRVIVDRRVGAVEAMRMSHQITTGNKITLFGLWVVLWFINLLGALALGIGLLITIPLSVVVSVVAYLMMSGQSINVPPA